MINVYIEREKERERKKYERREENRMNFYAKISAGNEERFKRYT